MTKTSTLFAAGLVTAAFLNGCASERAFVTVSYVVEPVKGLPPGMTTVSVMDSKVNEVTDRKWSELAANRLQDLLQQSAQRYGVDLKIADRKHLQEGMQEQDLDAAGVTTASSRGMGGSVLKTDGIIESEINVKVDTKRGADTTISGISGWGGSRHGGGSVQTREVETVTRNIVVQTTFKLVDTVSNRNWDTYSPEPYSQTDRTKTSVLFGSSKTEAELTPRDKIIGAAVAQGVQEFVSRLVPCKMQFEMVVESSGNKECAAGVKMLRGDNFVAALHHFKMALAEDGNDAKAAFGAGVAAEASGDYESALSYYRKAYAMNPDPMYRDAKDRMANHKDRIRGTT